MGAIAAKHFAVRKELELVSGQSVAPVGTDVSAEHGEPL